MELTGDYKGFEIRFIVESRTFQARKEGETVYHDKLIEKVMGWIDRASNKEFERVKAFVLKDGLEPVSVEVTGIDSYGNAWTREIEGGKREKTSHTLYLDTPANRKLLKAARAVHIKEKALETERRAILKQMKTYDPLAEEPALRGNDEEG